MLNVDTSKTMRFVALIFTFWATMPLNAQQDYAKTILDSLCAPRYDGRGYVNNGDNRAGDFIVRELEKIGVCPFKNRGFEQPYSINVNTFPTTVTVVLDDDTLIPGADYLVDAVSGSAAGDFDIIEVNPTNIREKFQNEMQTSTKKQRLYAFNFTTVKDVKLRQEYKRMAYQTIQYYPVIWVETGKQMYSVGRQQANYPLIAIDSARYKTATKAALNIYSQYIPNYTTKNVIGLIPGKKKRKYVVFSAHYDHLGRMGESTYFPGANDNASGVAMLLSLAKYFREHPPTYSIAFCFFSGEEAGLEGSKYFVSHPFVKLKQVKFVLNVDIMGGASDGVTVVNGSKHQTAFDELVAINDAKGYLAQVKKEGRALIQIIFSFQKMVYLPFSFMPWEMLKTIMTFTTRQTIHRLKNLMRCRLYWLIL